VPAAIEARLRAKNVVPVHVVVGASPTAFPPSDAAFLSLDTASAKTWFADAKSAGFTPDRGVMAMSPLADASLAASMPPGTRIVSPYLLIDNGQGQLSADAIHGWLTAKLLVEALRRSGGLSSRALRDVLTGYDDGFGRLYATRPGGNIRTPDGIVLRSDGRSLVPEGGFRIAADG
jgi:hypothetical protein